jgi:hypothetical protein
VSELLAPVGASDRVVVAVFPDSIALIVGREDEEGLREVLLLSATDARKLARALNKACVKFRKDVSCDCN